MGKNLIYAVAGNPLVRMATRAVLVLLRLGDRVWSHLRFRSLVPQSGRSVCHWSVEIKYGPHLSVGDHTSIGPGCSLGAHSPIEIGSFVRISRGVIIETAGLNLATPPPYKHVSKPIRIEDGVWIASHAIVLGGVCIGKNSIIGAGAVVTKDVPPNSIIVGQPMRSLDKKVGTPELAPMPSFA